MDTAGDKEIVPPELRLDAMGSAEAAGSSSHGPGASSCGPLGSLFPNSCRGRAEAFARRLHRRLTSLGSSTSTTLPSDSKITETTWLQSNFKTPDSLSKSGGSGNEAVACQPKLDPESEVFYESNVFPDHESENELGVRTPDSPGSPGEVVTAAELASLLVNHSEKLKMNHHDSCHCTKTTRPVEDCLKSRGAGCVFAPPIGDHTSEENFSESTSEIYYDPNSSEDDKTQTEEYYDPLSISDSELGVFMVNGDVSKPPGRRRIEFHPISLEECSGVSDNAMNGHLDHDEDILIAKGLTNGDSQDSLNDVVSPMEMTSPCQDGSFDSNGILLEDIISPILLRNDIQSSDDVFIQKSLVNCEPTQGCSRKLKSYVETTSRDEIDFEKHSPTENPPNGCNCDQIKISGIVNNEEDSQTASDSVEIVGVLELECSAGQVEKEEELLQNGVNLLVDDVIRVEDMSRLLGKLSISGGLDEKKEDDEGNEEENPDDVGEEERPRRLRRCSSLKTGKTPPGTPGRKKIVRFADVLGLDLADVRTFLDEIPKIPNSAYSDLIYDDIFQKDSSPSLYGSSPTKNGSIPAFFPRFCGTPGSMSLEKVLVPLFQQPGGLPNFLDLVRDRQVCLENVLVKDPITMCISGSVRVRNLDFHKSVHIRYSLDSWKNFADLQGLYVNGSCDGFSDKFTFQLYCHTLKVGQRLELAVRFQCKGLQYWDNNAGANYCFQCLPTTQAVSYIPITTPRSNSSHDWSPAFY